MTTEPSLLTNAEWSALLLRKKIVLGTIESFTGGSLAARFIQIPGASQWFYQGLVLYQTQAKAQFLGLELSKVQAIDPVSEKMIQVLLQRAQEQYPQILWLATTGNAGPTAHGSSPIGRMVIGIAGQATMIQRFDVKGTRSEIQKAGVDYALSLLKTYLSTY